VLSGLKALPICAVMVLSSVGGMSACGSASRSTRPVATGVGGASSLTPGSSERDTDGDVDSFGRSSYDNDNDAILAFGPAADPVDRRAILALVGRYYAVAAADRPGKACSMLDPLIVEAALEEHSEGNGPASLRGSTCTRILSELFKQRHRELVEDLAASQAIAVQVKGNRAVALMRFAGRRERRVPVRRTGASWKMDALLDGGSP
jgi:hypothetical protein